ELVGSQTDGSDSLLHGRFVAAMDNDLNTPEALILLQQAALTALAERDRHTGAEVLRLAAVLGLRV
ncbi:MAG TPA: DALR domain-containing protein, partial [Ktedonobacteraceae bacterium]|nr:DALR domain-containing protein [Ktedonobacteraceae bacterium]